VILCFLSLSDSYERILQKERRAQETSSIETADEAAASVRGRLQRRRK